MKLHERVVRKSSGGPGVALSRFVAILTLGWAALQGSASPSGLELCLVMFIASVLLIASADRSTRPGMSLIMAFIVATTMAPANFSEAPTPFAAAVAAALLALGLLTTRTASALPPLRQALSPTMKWLVATVSIVGFVITSLNSGELNLSSYFLYAVVLPILAVSLGSKLSESDLRAFSRGMFMFAFIQILFSAFDVLLNIPYPLWGYWLEGGARSTNSLLADQVFRAQGLSSHSIFYSVCVLLALSFVLSNAVRWGTVVRIGTGAFLIFGLLLSGTRSAALSAILIITLYGLFQVRRVSGKLIFVGCMFLATAYIVQVNSAANFLGALSSDLLGSGSFTHRLDGLKTVRDVAMDRGFLALLLGDGGASVPALFARGFLQQDGLAVVDNQLVTSFLVGGLLGLVIIVSCVIVGLTARGGVGMAMLAISVMIFSFDILTWPAGVVVFYGLVGCGLGLRRIKSSGNEPLTTSVRTSQYGLAPNGLELR